MSRYVYLSIHEDEDEMMEKIAVALSSKIRRDILRTVNDLSYNISEIAKILDMPISTVAFHVKHLREAGLVNVQERMMTRGVETTDINADDVIGKKLQAVYKDGILTLRLDGQILNLYTNETYLASEGKSTQVKDVFDLTKELSCGLLTNTKGMIIKDWAFTNIDENVANNPKLNGTLSGQVTLSVNTMKLDQVRLTLHSKDGKTNFHTYASADGTYEMNAPVGEYQLVVSNDGKATYTPYEYDVIVTKDGKIQDIALNSKNAVQDTTFVLTEEGYYQRSTNGYPC